MRWADDPLLTDENNKYTTDLNYINLYRALVRPKEDFKDINFALRTPFLVGDKLSEYVELLLISKFASFDSGLLVAIKYINEYTGVDFYLAYKAKYRYKQALKQNKINIILARVISIICSNSKEEGITLFNQILEKTELFTGMTNKAILLPKTISDLLTNKIVYLSGVIAGDGHLDKRQSCIRIMDGQSNEDLLIHSKEFIELLSNLFLESFNMNSTIFKEGNAWSIIISSKWLVRLFNYFFDLQIGNKTFNIHRPDILDLNEELEKFFWRGLFDTDGSLRNNLKGICFVTVSEKLKSDLELFCKKYNIHYKLREKSMYKRAYEFHIFAKSYMEFAKSIGFSHPRKLKIFLKHLKDGPSYVQFNGANPNMITDKGYYNFEKTSICVYGLGKFIRNLRVNANFTLEKLGKHFGETKKSIWRFENEEYPLPLNVYFKICKLCGISKNIAYETMSTSLLSFCIPRMRNRIRLPLKPNAKALEVFSYLRPYKTNTFVRISEYLDLADDKIIRHRLSDVENLLRIKPLCVKRNSKHNQYYICSAVLSTFLKTFHIYELPWEGLSEDHFLCNLSGSL